MRKFKTGAIIPEFPDYCITKDGRVWSRKNNKWLKPNIERTGHLRVWLYTRGKRVSRFVHHLILETFVGPREVGKECRHLDGNPNNNILENLCYGTKSENQVDSVVQGTSFPLKLSSKDVRMIVYMYSTGNFLQKEIAKIYNVSKATISDIICKRTWRHLWIR